MPNRYGHTAVIFYDIMWVFGGVDQAGHTYTDSVYAYHFGIHIDAFLYLFFFPFPANCNHNQERTYGNECRVTVLGQ